MDRESRVRRRGATPPAGGGPSQPAKNRDEKSGAAKGVPPCAQSVRDAKKLEYLTKHLKGRQLDLYLDRVEAPRRRKIKRGKRSRKDAKAWKCSCGRLNRPTQHLLVDLPAFNCGRCGKECDMDFDFCFQKLAVNGVCPVGNVKYQGRTPHCTGHSTTSAAEVTDRMSTLLSGGEVHGDAFSVKDINDKYEFARLRHGINPDQEFKWNFTTILVMCGALICLGIESLATRPKLYKVVTGYVKVNGSFGDMCSVLADGYPLITSFVTGKSFKYLKPGQIYKAPPFVAGESEVMHAVLLVGAGRRRKTNYFHFMNSWGESFCVKQPARNGEKAKGGFGMLRASDIRTQPIKLLRFTEEVEEHKNLPTTFRGTEGQIRINTPEDSTHLGDGVQDVMNAPTASLTRYELALQRIREASGKANVELWSTNLNGDAAQVSRNAEERNYDPGSEGRERKFLVR